jgi:hypothetical protein
VELMALGRDGGLLAVGAQGLRWGGLPAHALSAVLDAVGVFVGFGRLRHTSSLLKVRCVPNEGTGQSLKITLTQHRHVSCRAFGTMPGAIGYDRGNRDIDTHVYEATLPRQDRIVQHLLGLYDQVQQGSHDQQLQTFVALCAEAKAPYGQQTLVGGVVSQDVGVPVNLLPSELWSRWMPRGMALEAGWRAQSARVAHQSRLVAAATVEPKGTGPSAAVDDGGVRGFTVHHDQARSLGPEGRRLCRIEGQVVQGPGGEPLVTLANHWSMDRANANEVGAFILSPLNTLVGTHEGPLWGAGWRTSREATLSGAFTVTQLRQVADRVLRHGAGQGADSRQNQALCQLAEAIEAAVAKADGQGGWDPPATDGPDAADPLNMLADAIDTWARRAHLWALPWLHGLLLELDEPSKRHRRQELLELQERGKAVPPQKPTEPEDKDALKPLHLATDSDAYALPARLVRQLHLTEFKNVQARQRAAELACKRIDTCRALLASDPLVGQAQRNELEASFTLAKGWAQRLSQAV